jgi:hypothetical protein
MFGLWFMNSQVIINQFDDCFIRSYTINKSSQCEEILSPSRTLHVNFKIKVYGPLKWATQ